MTSKGCTRYKPWRLFERHPHIKLPASVRLIQMNYDDDDVPMIAFSCNFSPDDGNILACQSTFHSASVDYIARLNSSFVSIWHLDDMDCSVNSFTYSPIPPPRFSHCGNIFCSISNGTQGKLDILSYEEDDSEKKFLNNSIKCQGGNLCGRTKCLLISFHHAVTVTNLRMETDVRGCVLSLWRVVSSNKLKHLWMKRLDEIFNTRLENIYLLQCQFSPCLDFIGLLLTNGEFSLINLKEKRIALQTNLLQLVLPENENRQGFFPIFDFNTNFDYQIMAVGYLNHFSIINIANKSKSKQVKLRTSRLPERYNVVQHLSYSRNGCLMGICTDFGDTLIYSVNDGNLPVFSVERNPLYEYCLLHTLSFDEEEELFPEAKFCSFSSSSEEVAVAYSNGYVLVWQLPRIINLKEICRLKLMTLLAMTDVNVLDIPTKLKQYLNFNPSVK